MRPGFSYIAVLGTSLVVTTLAMGGLALVRVQARTLIDTMDATKARQYAQSAVEVSRFMIKNDPNWRNTYANGQVFFPRTAGTGTISASFTDPIDANISNHPHDSIRLLVNAVHGRATQRYRVDLAAKPIPLEVLNLGVHTWGSLRVRLGATLTVYGAATSTSGSATNDGTIDSDLVATTIAKTGNVLGTVTNSGPIHVLPRQAVVTAYRAIGTEFSNRINLVENAVIGPGHNPFGPLNADGVYIVRPTSSMTIRNTRIFGTLVVVLPNTSARLIVEQNVYFHSARPDYPVLIVEGNLELRYRSEGEVLSESATNVNFNPAGAPYLGVSDTDKVDNYPSEINGLIWATRRITWYENGLLRGAAIAEGQGGQGLDIYGQPRILHDPMLYFNPAPWLTARVDMIPDFGSWTQVVD